jgi:hypothetical protein
MSKEREWKIWKMEGMSLLISKFKYLKVKEWK